LKKLLTLIAFSVLLLVSVGAQQVFGNHHPQLDPQSEGMKAPVWVKNIFMWYSENRISEDELFNALQFLMDKGIITY